MWYLRLLGLLWFVTEPTNPGPGETVRFEPQNRGYIHTCAGSEAGSNRHAAAGYQTRE